MPVENVKLEENGSEAEVKEVLLEDNTFFIEELIEDYKDLKKLQAGRNPFVSENPMSVVEYVSVINQSTKIIETLIGAYNIDGFDANGKGLCIRK